MQSRVLSAGHPPRSAGWFGPRRSVWAIGLGSPCLGPGGHPAGGVDVGSSIPMGAIAG